MFAHDPHPPKHSLPPPFLCRFLGGPMHGQRLRLPWPSEMVGGDCSGGPRPISWTYFLVRATGYRLLYLHSPLAESLPAERYAGRRNPRETVARHVAAHAEDFKVCRGCGSLVFHPVHSATCPHCGHYGFDSERQEVLIAALALADSPPLWRNDHWTG